MPPGNPDVAQVLVVDDDPNTKYLLETFCLQRSDLSLQFAYNGQEALAVMDKTPVDAVITDLRMPVMDGEELLLHLRKSSPSLPVLIMTSYGSIEDAVDYLQKGADDYLSKPLTRDAFLHRIDRVIERLNLANEVEILRKRVDGKSQDNLIARSPAMSRVMNRIPTIAQTEASVVIYGASGTGKEVIAREIHRHSRRNEHALVAVNCGSLPENLLESELFGYKKGAFTGAENDNVGLVEEAHKGTLFLDEIGETSLSVQVKLLRFLQSKEYKPLGSPKNKIADVRIIAATNRDLAQGVADGSFREDLYYRLNIIPVHLPPLVERRADISVLASFFLERFNKKFERDVQFSGPEVRARLEEHDWPGNVRELENKIEQLAVMAVNGIISAEDIEFVPAPAMSRSNSSPRNRPQLKTFREEKSEVLSGFEKDYLTRVLIAEDGHITRAAKRAGMDRKNLWQLLKRHEIDASDYRRNA
ncbi:MAG: sigma-54 dependent transcriptional regulator [Myxococcota bacterium]|nr:sigma-54 dependent transcriptional regulator [Myxococcota bacterium]